MKVAVSASARSDLTARVAWLRERNPDAAAAFVEEVDGALRFLVRRPDAGRVVTLDGLRREVRVWPLPSLAIYYEFGEGVLSVVRVRHGTRRPVAW